MLGQVSTAHSLVGEANLPLFRHHQKTLDNQAFGDLRPNALEEAQQSFVLDDELHDLDETLEWLSLAGRRRLGLQANLGHNKWLRGYSS